MGEVVAWAFLAALNPTLLAATTVMLLLERPLRLMLGYWLGAMFVSVTLGLIIVFALEGSSTVRTTKNTLSPIADFVLAAICLVLAGVLASGRHRAVEERRQSRRAKRGGEKKTPKWQQQLSKGSTRTTFVIGVALSLPGASYLAGLNNIHKLHYSSAVTVLLVIGFNLVQLLLIEIPMVAFKVAPAQTPVAIERVKEWAHTHWRAAAVWGLLLIGVALAVKGIAEAT
jgi:Sap, sulfolipid-1-addressing protein